MKVLWLCNIVLPDYCSFYGFRKNPVGGWMSGMLRRLESEAEIAFCFPIKDSVYAKDGICNQHNIYSFPFYNSDYKNEVKERFIQILKDFKPDVIHIWGTEYPHSLAMVCASEELGMMERVVINIQGLVSVYADHYCADLPQKYLTMKVESFPTIEDEQRDFIHRGSYEIEAIQKVSHVIGRTDWDQACVKRINPNVNYYFCNEILREGFYRHVNEWKYEDCVKHTIFISQSSYPIKGLHYLLRVLPELVNDFPDLHVYVGGTNIMLPNADGFIRPYGMYLSSLIDRHQLFDRISFVGMLGEEEMIEQYKRANVYLSASTIENESNSLSEAALIGCPTVYSLVGGVISRADYLNGPGYQHNEVNMLSYYIRETFFRSHFESDSSRILDIVSEKKNSEITGSIYRRIQSDCT